MIKLDELIDMLDDINMYEYIVYNKKENDFIFIDLNLMSVKEYEEIINKIEEDEEEKYCYLPSKYIFHDSELIEEYIENVNNSKIQEDLEHAFYGRGKYRRFKDTLRRYNKEDEYYKFRYDYLKEMAIEWCKKNKIEFED